MPSRLGQFCLLWMYFSWDFLINKTNLRDLTAATGLTILLKLDSDRRFLSQCDLQIWWTTSTKNRALSIVSKPLVNSNLSYSLETLISGQNGAFLVPRDLEIWRMTFEINRAPLLSNIKLRATLKFNRWPCKTIGHVFYSTSSFVHRSKAIGEFKL